MKTIHITDETYEFLKNLAHELETQDNCFTANPFWVVAVDYKINAMHPDYCDDNVEYVENQTGDFEAFKTREEAIKSLIEYGLDKDEVEDNSHEYIDKFGFTHIQRSHNFFLTRKGYEQHMKLNGHNYNGASNKDARPYVECALRNPEYDGLIKAIKEIGRI